jgi:hypothetical protein
MAKKYEKYFLSVDKPATMTTYMQLDPKTSKRQRYMDEKVVPGCEFGCDNIWLLPGAPKERKIMDANKQPYDRFFGFYSFNYENVRDLCAEMEVYIGGEKHIVKRSGAIFIPANLEVGPWTFRNITKPIFFTIEFPCGEGLKKKYN